MMRYRVAPNRAVALSTAILAALVALTISGVFAVTAGATVTRSLTSSADTKIVENAPTQNYGAATSLGVNGNIPSGSGKDAFALVKWDLSGIAPHTQVSSALVTLSVTTASPQTYQAYVLKRPWVESAATWNVYGSGKPWEVAGAKGSLDREATVAGSITPSVKGKNTLTLPLAVVQGWVDNPVTNQGIIIANPSSTRGFNFNSREVADPTRRPQLTINLNPDTTPPETTIDSGPSGTISSGDVSFTFSSSEAGSTFECQMDDEPFSACVSPRSYTALAAGDHTFSVRARDAAGNADATPASHSFTVAPADTAPPETTIDIGPLEDSMSSLGDVSFTFSASEAGSTFECSLDSAAYTACTSPRSYTGLVDDSHTFQVRATDAAGNTDASPASRSWTVDTTAPETTIDSGPPGIITVAEATFTFSSEEGATFECRLDAAAYSACSSPKSYTNLSNLSNGSHTFEVRATDAVGNVDATPATITFSVEVPPPTDSTPLETAIDSGPSGTVSGSSASFGFSSTEPDSTFECSLDGSAFELCSSPQSYTNLSDGSHTFQVRATDQAGSTDPAPASRTWTVDTTSPETTIDSGPSGIISSGDVSFTFSSSEAGSTFECRLDGAAFASCTSPKDYIGLSDSLHTFEVRAKDAAGNVDASPASQIFVMSVGAEVVSVPATDNSIGNGITRLNLDNTKDYIVDLPSEKRVGSVQIYGGDAITIVGGHITANPNHVTENGNNGKGAIALYIQKTTTGPVHVEGVLFDDSAGGQMDAIDMETPNATVTLKNIRALVSGSPDGIHGECYSGFWDVGQLNIDGFTCYSNHNGFYFNGNGPVDIKNANVGYRESPFMPGWASGRAFIIVDGGTTCGTQGLTISGPVHVYPPRPGLWAYERYTLPNTRNPAGCTSSVQDNYVTWPRLAGVSGGVRLGPPPNGDFVPAGMAGVGYDAG